MKKHISIRRFIAITFMFVLAATTSVAIANDSSRHPRIPVEMKFLGNINEQPVFQLIFSDGSLLNDYTITVRDEYHEVLYRERIKSEQASRKFMLNTDELRDTDLLFEVFCNKTKQTIVYRVNIETKYVQHASISETSSVVRN